MALPVAVAVALPVAVAVVLSVAVAVAVAVASPEAVAVALPVAVAAALPEAVAVALPEAETLVSPDVFSLLPGKTLKQRETTTLLKPLSILFLSYPPPYLFRLVSCRWVERRGHPEQVNNIPFGKKTTH